MNTTNHRTPRRRDLKARMERFAPGTIDLVNHQPRGHTEDVLGRQLLRCATSVGANYRAGCRARSRAELIAKLGIVEEEADEAIYWMELLQSAGMASEDRITPLLAEANELLAITIASIKTARRNTRR